MINIGAITCIKDKNEDWIKTFESIKNNLGTDFNWILKFSHHCDNDFLNSIPSMPSIKKIHCEDDSLYDGINQALKECKTKYYMVLGAGDEIIQENIINIIQEISKNPDKDAYYFSTIIKESGNILIPNSSEISTRMSCPHPSSILQTTKSLEIGGFSLQYEIASDYDHLSRYNMIFNNSYNSSTPLCRFMGGGMSSTRSIEGSLEEELIRIRIHKSNHFAVHGRILSLSASNVTYLIKQNFK